MQHGAPPADFAELRDTLREVGTLIDRLEADRTKVAKADVDRGRALLGATFGRLAFCNCDDCHVLLVRLLRSMQEHLTERVAASDPERN